MSRSINILDVSQLPLTELQKIIKTVRSVFNLPVTLADSTLNIDDAYDGSRRQYNSTALLAQILNLPNPENNKIIAVVDNDLYIPILTFVFGEAQLDGTAAIVSTHRLSNQFYGLEPNYPLMIERLEKEIIHELCHTFGLIHCHQFECTMRSSTYVEEIDLKQHRPCSSCRRILWEKVNRLYREVGIGKNAVK